MITVIKMIRAYLEMHLPIPIQILITFITFPIGPGIGMYGIGMIMEFMGIE